MEPNSPDWLEDIESKLIQNKYSSSPHLELLFQVSSHPQLLHDYVFPKLLHHKDIILTDKAGSLAQFYIKEEYSLVEVIIDALEAGVEVDRLVEVLTWDLFEELVSAILNRSSWNSVRTYRFKSPYSRRSNHEIDVLAWNKQSRKVLFIDCKRYASTAPSLLKPAARTQVERVHIFHEALPDIYNDPLLEWVITDLEIEIIPLLVTWRDHSIRWYVDQGGKMPIVPIKSFMNFLSGDTLSNDKVFKLKWSVI